MKTFLVYALAILGCHPANAADVLSAQLNEEQSALELKVSYGGGFKDHHFRLSLEACFEGPSIQCSAKLVDSGSGDPGEAMFSKTVILSLSDAGLDLDYLKGALLVIHGSNNTSAAVQLPTSKDLEKRPVLKCSSASGSAFSAILVRGAHYDSICEVSFRKGLKPFKTYKASDCPGALYSSTPHFVLSINLEKYGIIEVKKSDAGELIYLDSSGVGAAKCEIANDFKNQRCVDQSPHDSCFNSENVKENRETPEGSQS